jgi:hypothetical protein
MHGSMNVKKKGHPVNIAGGTDYRLLSFPAKVVIHPIIINSKEQNPS